MDTPTFTNRAGLTANTKDFNYAFIRLVNRGLPSVLAACILNETTVHPNFLSMMKPLSQVIYSFNTWEYTEQEFLFWYGVTRTMDIQ